MQRNIASDRTSSFRLTESFEHCPAASSSGGLPVHREDASQRSAEGYRILGWNIGGADPHSLSKAIGDGSGSGLSQNDLVLLQELPREGEGWSYQSMQGRRLICSKA